MWSGGEQGAESVEVALVLVRGEVFDEGLEFGGEFGADAAGALDFVEDAAEPLLGLLDGVHGLQMRSDTGWVGRPVCRGVLRVACLLMRLGSSLVRVVCVVMRNGECATRSVRADARCVCWGGPARLRACRWIWL